MNDLHQIRSVLDRELAGIDAPTASAELVRRARRRRVRSLVGAGVAGLSCTAVLVVALASLLPMGRQGSTPANHPAPASTPENGSLLYAKYVGREGWSLFVVDPRTGRERRITHGYRDYGSDWSPDGTKIVYDSETEGSGLQEIVVANADGSGAMVVAEDGSVPAWSPDGTQIAFARAAHGQMTSLGHGLAVTAFHLFVMNADGTDVRQITHGDHSDYSPVWSPDGAQIVFHRDDSGLFVVSVDGSGLRRLTDGTPELLSAPDWSPDGASIAIAVNGEKNGPPGGIFLLPSDGSGSPSMIPGTAAPYPDDVSNPSWSPDGQFVAYTHGYRGELVIVRPDGRDERVLRLDPGQDSIEELAWGPRTAKQG